MENFMGCIGGRGLGDKGLASILFGFQCVCGFVAGI
jgi:hypothetical protein